MNLIGGFLGSGKTTLLRRLALDPEIGSKLAILINELGSSGLDEELVKQEELTEHLHIKQLASGCICCTLQGALFDSMKEFVELAQQRGIQKVIVETSGATNLSELSYSINAMGTKLPIYTESIIAVVDAKNAKQSYLEHQELFTAQLERSDLILLNKQDLVTKQEQEELLSWILPLCRQATWVWTVRANIPVPLLLGTGFLRRSFTDVEVVEPQSPAAAPITHHGLGAIEFADFIPITEENLIDIVQELAPYIFRIKGIVELLKKDKKEAYIVQVVGEQIELELLKENRPVKTRLIFIGKDPQKELIKEILSRYGLI